MGPISTSNEVGLTRVKDIALWPSYPGCYGTGTGTGTRTKLELNWPSAVNLLEELVNKGRRGELDWTPIANAQRLRLRNRLFSGFQGRDEDIRNRAHRSDSFAIDFDLSQRLRHQSSAPVPGIFNLSH